MSDMTFEQAAQALQSSGQAEAAAPGTGQVPAVETPGVTPDPLSQAAPQSQPQDFDLGVDPNTLPPELQAIYRQMQAGMTRKFQDVASLAKVRDDLAQVGITDPAQIAAYARAAYQLDHDPDYARRLAAKINEVYGPGQQAVQPLPTSPTPTLQQPTDPFNDDTDPLEARVQQMERELQETQQRYAQQEAAIRLAQQEAHIRALHPDYSDDDMSHLMEIAYSTGGDLMTANERYIAMGSHFAQRFLKGGQRQTQLPGTEPIPNVTTSQPNDGRPKTLRDATAAGVAMLRANQDSTFH
jgi:hypothetical protein